jgi:hypothetical protein
MAHVCGHVDFFKNNFCFKRPISNRPRKARKMDRQDGQPRRAHLGATSSATASTVEEFIDSACRWRTSSTRWSPFIRASPRPGRRGRREALRGPAAQGQADYMDKFINPEEYIEAQKKKEAREAEARAQASPSAPSATCSSSCSTTPRSSAGSATSSRWCATRPTTSCPRPDQDHERGLGHLLALEDHDREGARRLRDHRLRRANAGVWPPRPAASTPTSSASSCTATSRSAGTRASSARSGTSATDWTPAQLGPSARPRPQEDLRGPRALQRRHLPRRVPHPEFVHRA